MIVSITILDRTGRFLLFYEKDDGHYEFLNIELPDELSEEKMKQTLCSSINQFLGTTIREDDLVPHPRQVHPLGYPVYAVFSEFSESSAPPSRWPPGHHGMAYIHAMQTRWLFVAKTLAAEVLATITNINEAVLDQPEISNEDMDRAFTGTFLTVYGEYPKDFDNSKQVQKV